MRSRAGALRRPLLLAAVAALAAMLGACAASYTDPPAPRPYQSPGTSVALPDSAYMVLEVRMRRSAELSDNRGALRVFDQDVSAEYRLRGQGPGHDAGDVTLDGRPMRKVVSGKGAVSYRMGRDDQLAQAGGEPWVTIANSGADVPKTDARVKLAPFPLVTQPVPGLGVVRSEDLPVVMLPPVPDVWYRVSLSGNGPGVNAIDLGEGRWLFARGALDSLGTGRARILIEVETSCGNCRGPGLFLNWSTRSELEIPVTIL